MFAKKKAKILGVLMTIATLLAIASQVMPSNATTGNYLWIQAGKRYLTVEAWGCNIQIWYRSNPYQCSLGDRMYLSIPIKAITYTKTIYDAISAAKDCALCFAWVSGSAVCAYVTLPGVATELVCWSAYGGAIAQCSVCGANLFVKIIFPKS